MKFFKKAKDGGPDSTVTGYWLVEIKSLFSIVLMRFDDGSRDEFHSHAFNSINWVLRGRVQEVRLGEGILEHEPSPIPVVTRQGTFHRVISIGTTWVLGIRGPWAPNWLEYDADNQTLMKLEHGRGAVNAHGGVPWLDALADADGMQDNAAFWAEVERRSDQIRAARRQKKLDRIRRRAESLWADARRYL
jgi:hypothetical protein